MKQFNLDEFLRLKEEGKEPKIVTRCGAPVRIVCTDVQDKLYPVLALYRYYDTEDSLLTDTKGRYLGEEDDDLDLFFADLDEEPKYRPYKDADECFAEVQKHGGWMKHPTTEARMLITWVNPDHILSGENIFEFAEMVESYIWADDGSPCGVKEK